MYSALFNLLQDIKCLEITLWLCLQLNKNYLVVFVTCKIKNLYMVRLTNAKGMDPSGSATGRRRGLNVYEIQRYKVPCR